MQDLDLTIKKGQLYGLVGPNGAGKTTVFNMLTGVYQPTTGTFFLNGEELRGLSQEAINHKGIARTFQNIRLFNNMTVIHNVMVGLHNQKEFNSGVVSSVLRLPKHFRVEKQMREKAKEILLEKEIDILVELNSGDAKATAWGCDLTYDYVKINGDYRT